MGVGAIKRRRPEYAREIAESSGVAFRPQTPQSSATSWWTRNRGLSDRIVRELLAKHMPLHCETRRQLSFPLVRDFVSRRKFSATALLTLDESVRQI